jgi:hypothetical protein
MYEINVKFITHWYDNINIYDIFYSNLDNELWEFLNDKINLDCYRDFKELDRELSFYRNL